MQRSPPLPPLSAPQLTRAVNNYADTAFMLSMTTQTLCQCHHSQQLRGYAIFKSIQINFLIPLFFNQRLRKQAISQISSQNQKVCSVLFLVLDSRDTGGHCKFR